MTYRQNSLLLIGLFAMLVLLKIPDVLHGRLWAEDGLYLSDALRLPWWQVLLTQHTGYIDVAASTAMLVASHVTDLEHMALISVGMALLIQICPAILLVTSRCEWLQSRWIILALLLVLLPPASEEVWLSPVTSQYHLMLCAGLILAIETGTGPRFIFRCVLLATAGLSGPGPALVAPLFILRACIDRSYHRAVQALILAAGACVEIGYVYTYPEEHRHLGIGLLVLLDVIYLKHLVLPFFGWKIAFEVSHRIDVLSPLIALVVLGALVSAVVKAHSREVGWLFAAALTMMVLAYFGSLGSKTDLLDVYFGQRYYYAPQVLLGLTLLGLARTGPTMVRRVALPLVAVLILVGMWEYGQMNPEMAHGPSWQEQVALWRVDHRPIILWPATFQLQPDP